jgi:AAA+ superfamily predicted ATPase
VLDTLFSKRFEAKLFGVHAFYDHQTLTFAALSQDKDHSPVISPLQYDELDSGETLPARCLKNGLWLSRDGDLLFAVLLSPAHQYGQVQGLHLEVALLPGDKGAEFSRQLLEDIEKRVFQTGSYRGKVISLEASRNYAGMVTGVSVHKLRSVGREDVILPEKTIGLLERNITDFIKRRDGLRKLGMAVKKGILFYGPPGTGKTHTIHYLASQLPNHTTLLITAEQVGLIDDYFQLARFLQPAIVVIEDVDLIARAREQMRGACEESLLNRLLNEMDGLREDAELIFILTTNRPDQLEAALASRPGRIDQAIEFPLPDEEGRRKLVHLYSCNLRVPDDTMELIVAKTKNSTGAFIKELMRRCAQYHLGNSANDGTLSTENIQNALEEMLFTGGSLNRKILGAAES